MKYLGFLSLSFFVVLTNSKYGSTMAQVDTRALFHTDGPSTEVPSSVPSSAPSPVANLLMSIKKVKYETKIKKNGKRYKTNVKVVMKRKRHMQDVNLEFFWIATYPKGHSESDTITVTTNNNSAVNFGFKYYFSDDVKLGLVSVSKAGYEYFEEGNNEDENGCKWFHSTNCPIIDVTGANNTISIKKVNYWTKIKNSGDMYKSVVKVVMKRRAKEVEIELEYSFSDSSGGTSIESMVQETNDNGVAEFVKEFPLNVVGAAIGLLNVTDNLNGYPYRKEKNKINNATGCRWFTDSCPTLDAFEYPNRTSGPY